MRPFRIKVPQKKNREVYYLWIRQYTAFDHILLYVYLRYVNIKYYYYYYYY